jgi:hypothetical protein
VIVRELPPVVAVFLRASERIGASKVRYVLIVPTREATVRAHVSPCPTFAARIQAREVEEDQLAVLQLTISSLTLGLVSYKAKSRPETVVDVPTDTASFTGPPKDIIGASNVRLPT